MPNNVLACCYIMGLAAILIVNFHYSINYYDNIKDIVVLYQQPFENWKLDVISDFQVSLNCQGQSIVQYYWPGTYSGCQCTSGKLIIGDCCIISPDQDCTDPEECVGTNIPYIEGKLAEIWEFKNSAVKICVNRIKDYNYLKITNVGQDNCEQSLEKFCGSKDNGFCVPKKNKCPIRAIAFSPENSEMQVQFEEQIQINKGYFLYYTRNSSIMYPIAQFRVGQGEVLCLKWHKSIGTPKRTPNPLLRYDRTDAECETDIRFKKVVSIGEHEFLRVNGIELVTPNQTNDIPDDQFPYYIFYNHMNYINPLCRDDIPQIFNNSDLLKDIQTYCFYVILAFCVLIAHFLLFQFIFTSVLSENPTGGDIEDDNWRCGLIAFKTQVIRPNPESWKSGNKFLQCFIILKIFIYPGTLGVIGYTYNLINREKMFLDDLENRQCSDIYFDKLSQKLIQILDSYQIKIVLYLSITMIFFDATFFYSAYMILKTIKKSICRCYNLFSKQNKLIQNAQVFPTETDQLKNTIRNLDNAKPHQIFIDYPLQLVDDQFKNNNLNQVKSQDMDQLESDQGPSV